MKERRKRMALVMLLTLVMSAFAACGGGGSSEVNTENEGANAEPNSGVQGIVYAVPDGWKQTSVEAGRASFFEKDGSDFIINVFATTQDHLKEYGGEGASMTIEEYYKKYYTPDPKKQKEKNIEGKEITICDVSGYYGERKNDNGIISAGTEWMYDNVIYSVSIGSKETEYDDNGNITNSPAGASDEDLADFDYLLASIRPGDGNALQSTEVAIDSVGEFTFDVPAGYKVTDGNKESFVNFNKDDGDAYIRINKTVEEDFANWEGEDIPKTLQEYYEGGMFDGVEKITVAGYEGYMDFSEEDDGKTYSGRAVFMTEDAVYDIHIQAADEIWDESGLKEGITPLTDDDIAAYKALINSIKKK